MNRKGVNQVHTVLINNCTIEEKLEAELKELESKRGNVHERHRKELEKRIGRKKDFIKFVKEQELQIRELFDYLDYDRK